MIGSVKTYYERLYLHKDNENEIYVNNSQNLKQHQIDSLRFLYRQFNKKKFGAVLNFPAGSGKSLVVTLFLNAVSALLKERVLILCLDDEEMDNWQQMFLKWTQYGSDDIAVESSNPRVKKKIFLKKADNLASYLRWHWSVVVIKDENMCKSLQKVVLDADLKIWITSTDVKKDISLLLFIYNWMFPKSNVDINEIILGRDNPKEKLVQSIIMDTFLNDFVIRENKVKVIRETKDSQMLKIYKNSAQTATTRKNKDPTGTKVKKSKRTMNLHTDVCNISTEDTTEAPHPEISDESIDIMAINYKTRIDKDVDIKPNTGRIENDNINLEINQTALKVENTEESSDFNKCPDDFVVNENNITCVEENSTESLDFGDETTDSVLDKTCYYDESKHVDNDVKMDINTSMTTETSVKGRNDLDFKMSELEERTMKKFKGSLLDSLF